jgi:uncharacterized protein with PQ loop repeat
MTETALGIVAATWGVVMAVSPVLQIRRILQRRSSEDVSIGYLAVVVFGFSVWIAYGIALRNLALIVPNTIALLVGVATIAVALRYRSGHGERTRAARPDGAASLGRQAAAGAPPAAGGAVSPGQERRIGRS